MPLDFGLPPGRFGLFPRILPDELVYSVLGRYCSMMQSSTYRLLDSAFASFGRRRISILYTSRLSALADCLPPGSPNAGQLVASSSLYRYLSHFLTAADRERLLLHLLHGATFSVQGIARIISRLPGVPHCLAFCPDCVKEDVASVRRGGWRRVHQMPLVFRCPWHDTPLRTERTAVGSRPDFVTCPSDADAGVELECPLGRRDAAAVARLTLDALGGNGAGLATLDDVERAYGKTSGRSRAREQLEADLVKRFGARTLSRITGEDEPRFVQFAMRRQGTMTMHPAGAMLLSLLLM